MLFICVNCGRIIGCNDSNDVKMKDYCFKCPHEQACKTETPVGMAVKRMVVFLHLPNKCSDHERPQIGYCSSKCDSNPY